VTGGWVAVAHALGARQEATMTTRWMIRSPSVQAASRSRGSPADAASAADPAPSLTCNIGPGELRRRRRSARVAVTALAAALLAIGVGILPAWSLPYLAPLVGAVVGTVLQVVMRFCLAFGFAGLVGMGETPGATPVDRELRLAHRRRATRLALAAAAAALGWALLTGALVHALT
jgi:hypothetical protein